MAVQMDKNCLNGQWLPCPFCSCSEVELIRAGTRFSAECSQCGIRTSECNNPGDALEIWNETVIRERF